MDEQAMNPAILVRNLSVTFGGRPALTGLNLSLAGRDINVLLGRSGCGKTTFLRTLNRLNEELGGRTRGEAWIELSGQWLSILDRTTNVQRLRQKVGMVFQSPNVLPVSIARNITLPLRLNSGCSKNEAEHRMEAVLRQVHLWQEVKDRLKSSASDLSGGQQQRLCLARTLALNPEVLLLDEPTSSLDYRASQTIEALLLELASDYTLVVVSHSLAQAKRLAKEILVFEEGGETSRVQRVPRGVDGFEQYVSTLF
jgi:phosphate transport system ATP-binding protein